MKGAIGKSRVVSPMALLVLTACIVGAGLLTGCGSGTSSSSRNRIKANEQPPVTTSAPTPARIPSTASITATGQQKLIIYSVPVLAQYIDKADDRQRAIGHNPFQTDTGKLVSKDKGKGPFAGDDTFYSFMLYTSTNLKKKVGSAVYTCHYNFAKNALCTAYFELKGGSLLASGRVLFTSKTFTLAITGGTNKYFAANGEVAMAPVTKNMQRLSFVLLGS